MHPVAGVSASALRLSDSHLRHRMNNDHFTFLLFVQAFQLFAL